VIFIGNSASYDFFFAILDVVFLPATMKRKRPLTGLPEGRH
jgi:hypothetical protein